MSERQLPLVLSAIYEEDPIVQRALERNRTNPEAHGAMTADTLSRDVTSWLTAFCRNCTQQIRYCILRAPPEHGDSANEYDEQKPPKDYLHALIETDSPPELSNRQSAWDIEEELLETDSIEGVFVYFYQTPDQKQAEQTVQAIQKEFTPLLKNFVQACESKTKRRQARRKPRRVAA